jgi:hypothetical protein
VQFTFYLLRLVTWFLSKEEAVNAWIGKDTMVVKYGVDLITSPG